MVSRSCFGAPTDGSAFGGGKIRGGGSRSTFVGGARVGLYALTSTQATTGDSNTGGSATCGSTMVSRSCAGAPTDGSAFGGAGVRGGGSRSTFVGGARVGLYASASTPRLWL